jgi:hypothetical protein
VAIAEFRCRDRQDLAASCAAVAGALAERAPRRAFFAVDEVGTALALLSPEEIHRHVR